MDIFNQYDIFKEKCEEFSDKLEERCFGSCKLICHPAAENVLISMCSDEEAHSNALCICRMADMLLMSDEGDDWAAFNLAEARRVAEQNGYIYLTDLFAESAFQSEDWMINGKNDTVIVSEAYMREKGKRYAPVTPLTNKVLHFKKYSDGGFFWKPANPGEIILIDNDYIDGCFKEFFSCCTEKLPDLSESETIDFPLFNGKVTIDVNTTRIRTIEQFFATLNEIAEVLDSTAEVTEICGYDFSAADFLTEIAAAALRNNGIDISKDGFAEKYFKPLRNAADTAERLAALGQGSGNSDADFVKLAFIDAVNAEYPDKIELSVGDFGFYNDNICRLEQGSFAPEEEKYLVSEILSHRPADYRIFCFINKKYPEESANAAAIAEFWQIAPLNEEELENTVLGAYLPDDKFDEQGRFCAGYEESRILREQIGRVIDRYGLSNREVLDELDRRTEQLDRERRTFNGTLFDTPEEMKLAVRNEVYVQELCADLSALNEQELNELDRHIEDTTLDTGTKSKYKLKIKLAMNNVRSSMLEQKCLKLPIMSLDEINGLKKDIAAADYPEAVVKPFAVRIRDAFVSAQTAEIEDMLKAGEGDNDKLDKAAEKLGSGRYDKLIAEHYRRKIDEIKESNLRAKLEKLTEGFESFGREQLGELIEKLKTSDFPQRLTMPVIRKVTDALNNYEANEAAKMFEGVDIADEEQLGRMKRAIEDKLYREDILEPYILRVEQREKELRDEKLGEMCKNIDTMQQEELYKLRAEITDTEKGFDQQLIEKYLDRITQRDCELKNSELAELCKYIFSMEQHELDELKEKLSDERYDKEFTEVYYRKIAEREQELLVVELDRLCAGIDDADMDVLEKLRNRILDDERYDGVSDDYIAAINNRIDAIKVQEYKRLIDDAAFMTEEELESFRKNAEEKRFEIGDELYELSMNAVNDREDALEREAIVKICGNIEAYGFEQAEEVRAQLADGGFDPEKLAPYIERIDDRITELHTERLNSYIEGMESMNKEQLIQAQIKIGEYTDCPAYLREKYDRIVQSAIADIADREIRSLCGNISELSAKRSENLIRRINTMPLDERSKSKYIDALDAHISALKDAESRQYISRLTSDMAEYNINAVHLSVPGMSNLFLTKYQTACSTYVSVGRYELPILVHDGNSGDGFTMTTEYLYTLNGGVMNRIKVDDIASFQAKKSFMSSSLLAVEKNGSTSELPNALKKDVVENVAKVLTALVNFIHDKRSEEHMKELMENAVQEKAAQAAEMSAEIPVRTAPAPEHMKQPVPQTEPAGIAELSDLAEPAAASELAKDEAVKPTAAAEFEPISAPSLASLDDGFEEPAVKEQPKVPAIEPEKAEAPEIAPEPRVKFCDQCGARITSPTAKFCAECGNKLC